MAILPESGHAKFLKFLDVSNTNFQNTKLEFLTKFGRKRSTFTMPKETFLKYPENTEKWPFCLENHFLRS